MLKKTIIAMALVATTLSANAQRGSWYAGGAVGFSSETQKTENSGTETKGPQTTDWSFRPEVGTFLTDNVQVGIGLTLGGSKVDQRGTTTNVSKSMYTGGTIYGRYFFGKAAFRPFVGVNISVLPGTTENETGSGTIKYKIMTMGANLNAGFSYALAPRVCVVGSFGTLGFQRETSKLDGSDAKTTKTTAGLDASTLNERFNVGVYYTLTK
jgi:hypothetical protein